jgi:predicted ATPase
MVFLRSLELKRGNRAGFPFNLPLFQELGHLRLDAPVTFLVGENGSGKSTLLEGLAVATQRIAVGADNLADDESMEVARRLGQELRLVWSRRTALGFFLRAEDFFGYVRRLNQMQREVELEARQIQDTYRREQRSDYATGLALGTVRGQATALREQYQALEQRSHGESFLHFFQSRVVPGGLYILDEPETPLSPQNQIAFLAVLHEAVSQGSQFVIATHSPILMAYPEAVIYCLDRLPPKPMEYRALDHFRLTRDFLNNPEIYLRHLLGEEMG